jgi:multicomponent Na+:H+ antiporter subunit B
MKTVQDRAQNRRLGESLIIVHGHYSPGGGFQGGVILGASFILLALAFDLPTTMERMSERSNALLANVGVLIFTGVATLCAFIGGYLLDYSALAALIPMDPIEWRSLGIFLVEVGVGVGVMSIMVSLFWDISSAGEMDEGL